MNKLIKLLSFILVLGIFSCGNDDEAPANCTDFNETIVGTWECAPCGEGEATFNADGSLSDPNGLFLDAEVGGVSLDNKTWSSDGTNLNVRAETLGGQFLEAEIMIVETNCDRITLSILSQEFDITRK